MKEKHSIQVRNDGQEISLNSQKFNDLMALSGLEFHGFKYDCKQWLAKTGVDPKKYHPEYIHITRYGLVGCTKKYRDLIKSYQDYHYNNMAAIGVKMS